MARILALKADRVTIRRILLLAFLGAGLLPAVILTALSFTRTQAAMRGEIEQSLSAQAAVTAADVDKELFERLQNAVTWTHLEVMQDLHVGDVDKRLSGFLAEMKLRYGGVYTALHAADPSGRIVASSEPAAIGTRLAPATDGQRAELPGGAVLAEPPRVEAGGKVLRLRTPIVSEFTAAPLGELVLLVDWDEADRALDAAARDRRAIAVIDAQGRIVAASRSLRERLGEDFAQLPAVWRIDGSVAERDGAPLLDGPAIVAGARAPGQGPFAGFGWTTLVLQSSTAALAPVRHMALTFLGLLALTAAATVPLAFWVSDRIARPIVALTAYARGFMRKQAAAPPPAAGGEVGELTRAFVQMVDDLDASRQTLVRASQLAAIGEFAAMMAHEIRTPLGILRSSAQMLEREPALGAEARELTGFIVSETQRLNRLVAALLDSARAQPPHRRPADIDALVERCLNMLGQQAVRQGVVFEHALAAGDPVVDADAEQITQVLLNLLLNALQALPDGGRVRVATRGDADSLSVEVADNGPGIAAAERHRMFEPFVYRREGGLGLGLAVVKQIVTAHGGEIAVESDATLGGACFRIRLPRRAPAA